MADLIVCRCEGVPEDAIAAAVAGGALTPRQVKLATRAGMGPCQGRVCRHLVECLVQHLAPVQSGGAAAPLTRRLPYRPVPFGVLAGEGEEA